MLYGTVTEFCIPSEVIISSFPPHASPSVPSIQLAIAPQSREHARSPCCLPYLWICILPSSAQSCLQDHGQSVYPIYTALSISCPFLQVRMLTMCAIVALLLSSVFASFYFCRYEYLWEDGVRYKRPTKLPAPEYVDALMNWAQQILDDENVFPNKLGELISRF